MLSFLIFVYLVGCAGSYFYLRRYARHVYAPPMVIFWPVFFGMALIFWLAAQGQKPKR